MCIYNNIFIGKRPQVHKEAIIRQSPGETVKVLHRVHRMKEMGQTARQTDRQKCMLHPLHLMPEGGMLPGG